MSLIEIVSVRVGRPKVLLEHHSGDVISSIVKHPVTEPSLWLSTTNLDGDEQADQRPTPFGGQVHGGAHQAVYVYPVEHYDSWAPEILDGLDLEIAPGLFGENVTTRGATEDDVGIGDVWAWGDALLQVSAPRGPCYKLGIRLGRQAVRRDIRESGRVGWYLRVVREGHVPTTGHIEVVASHAAGVTVADVHRAMQARGTAGPPDLLDLDVLAPNVRGALRIPGRDLEGGVPERDH